jgi:hypothetical protein
MAKTKEKHKKKRRKLPIAVTIIALLAVGEIVLRLYWVTRTALHLDLFAGVLPAPLWAAGGPTETGVELGVAAFRLLWALIGIAVYIALLRMRRWSWVVLVVWVGVSLTIGILRYFYREVGNFGLSDYLVMTADMVLAFALNQSDVQRIYGIRRDDAEALA